MTFLSRRGHSGRRILIPRLRARSLKGTELMLPSFVYAAGRDPLDARTLEAMAIGDRLEPVPEQPGKTDGGQIDRRGHRLTLVRCRR